MPGAGVMLGNLWLFYQEVNTNGTAQNNGHTHCSPDNNHGSEFNVIALVISGYWTVQGHKISKQENLIPANIAMDGM